MALDPTQITQGGFFTVLAAAFVFALRVFEKWKQKGAQDEGDAREQRGEERNVASSARVEHLERIIERYGYLVQDHELRLGTLETDVRHINKRLRD